MERTLEMSSRYCPSCGTGLTVNDDYDIVECSGCGKSYFGFELLTDSNAAKRIENQYATNTESERESTVVIKKTNGSRQKAAQHKKAKFLKMLIFWGVILAVCLFIFSQCATRLMGGILGNQNAFQYINHDLNECARWNLIKNGGLQTMSHLGLSSADCEYYRSYIEDERESVYFCVQENLITAAACFDYRGTVKELIDAEYPLLSKQEPRVELEDQGLAANIFWETDSGVLCVYSSMDYNWEGQPTAEYGDYNVLWHVEYTNDFEYNPDSPTQHPQNLIAYLAYSNYSISDVEWHATPVDWVIEGLLFDCYIWENRLDGVYLFVEIEPPFRIYKQDEMYSSAPYLVWEGQTDQNANTNSFSNVDTEEQDLLITVESFETTVDLEMRSTWYDDGVFFSFFKDVYSDNTECTYSYIGTTSYPDFAMPDYDIYSFDIYKVDFHDGWYIYYLVPYSEIGIQPNVYVFLEGVAPELVWTG